MFRQKISNLLCYFLSIVAGSCCALSAAAKVPMAEFVERAVVVSPVLSPDGRFLAVAKTSDDRAKTVVAVIELDAPNTSPTIAMYTETAKVKWVRWANNDRLLIGATDSIFLAEGIRVHAGFSRVVSVDRQGGALTVLFANQQWLRYASDLTQIVHPLPDEPNFVLMAASDEYGKSNLYRVNINDGKAVLVHRGTRGTTNWLTDLQGHPKVRWDEESTLGRTDVLFRKGESDDWDVVARYDSRDLPELNIVGFGDDPTTAIVASRGGTDRYGLYEYNVVSRSFGRQLFQHARVDVGSPFGGPIYDPYTTKVLGIDYVDDVWFSHYFDPDLAAIQQKMEIHFSDSAIVSPFSWSKDRKHFVVYTEGPRDPGSYHLYDVPKNSMTLIGRRFPKLTPTELGEMVVVKYLAKDGTAIPGYLTMPPGKGAKNLPMIVMPHGGPELRDYVQYDSWVQMLANRGYAVFQPNFRGSGGYGKAFTEAGHRQWGRLMQDDISDGVRALIKDGTADPARICIVGASYGGYAALAGGAFTPELYKCVVSVAGVSDIPMMLKDDKISYGKDSYTYNYWKKWVGDPKIDFEQMKAVSPAFHAEKFVAPVLLIHGTLDTNVRYSQSVRMEKALFKAHKAVELVLIDLEGHSFILPPTRLKLFNQLERFLSVHIGN